MNPSLSTDGYEIHRKVIGGEHLLALRNEADSVSQRAGSVCVRHLRARSELINTLAVSTHVLSLLPHGLIPVRSILFDKTQRENWPVPWHQDLTVAVKQMRPAAGYGPWSVKDGTPHVQPPVALLQHMVTVRIHLDDTPASNGALRVVPRSHRVGRIAPDEILQHAGEQPVTCECGPGDVLLMSPLILHSSRRSEFPVRRRVLHFEYARLDDLHPDLEWFERDS